MSKLGFSAILFHEFYYAALKVPLQSCLCCVEITNPIVFVFQKNTSKNLPGNGKHCTIVTKSFGILYFLPFYDYLILVGYCSINVLLGSVKGTTSTLFIYFDIFCSEKPQESDLVVGFHEIFGLSDMQIAFAIIFFFVTICPSLCCQD